MTNILLDQLNGFIFPTTISMKAPETGNGEADG